MKTIFEKTTFGELVEGDLITIGGYHKNVKNLKITDTGFVEFLAVDAEKVPNTNTFETPVRDLPQTITFRVVEDHFGSAMTAIIWITGLLIAYTVVWGILGLLVQIFNPSLLWSFLN